MKKLVDRLFADFGVSAQLCADTRTQTLQVVFQCVRSKSQQGAERIFMPLGQVPREQYVCYFPADTAVSAQDTLVVEGVSYRICRAEPMLGKEGRPLYVWSLCVQKDGEDVWG